MRLSTGEIWFDENSQYRIIKWLNKHAITKDTSILDLGENRIKFLMNFINKLKLTGTGNGMMLIELSNDDFTNLTGVDYSEKSIAFAKKIAADQNHSQINFKVLDILAEENSLGTYQIVHDKGTYDAIALMENAVEHRKTYVKNISKLVEDLFIITSCNFTEDELIESFSAHFTKFETIPTPAFQFGGKKGNKITSICFKRKQ